MTMHLDALARIYASAYSAGRSIPPETRRTNADAATAHFIQLANLPEPTVAVPEDRSSVRLARIVESYNLLRLNSPEERAVSSIVGSRSWFIWIDRAPLAEIRRVEQTLGIRS